LGIDVRASGAGHVSIALSYEGIIMPTFAVEARGQSMDRAAARDTSFHALLVSTGFWYGQ
jgi:hypothetical protein